MKSPPTAMQIKNKVVIFTMSLLIFLLLTYLLWLCLRPVKIVDVHEDGNFSHILVKNFPITDRGQINWWLKNKGMIKKRYNIPQPDSDGEFTVVIWDFGEGYKEQGDESKDDRFCFVDSHTPRNCIDKNKDFYVSFSKNTGINFITDSAIYRIDKSGKFVKKEAN